MNKHYSILVIDQDRDARAQILALLSDIDHCTAEAVADAAGAVSYLTRDDSSFDLILLAMDQGGGIDVSVMQDIRSLSSGTQFMILTRTREDARVLECLKAGAMDLILKPLDAKDFCRTIKMCLTRLSHIKEGDEVTVKSDLQGWVELTAPTDFEYVERFRKFTALLGNVPLSEEESEDVRLAVDELGQNAVEWGNRGDRSKQINLSYCVFADRILFKIEDEGDGFDSSVLRDPTVDPVEHIMAREREGKRMGGYGVFMSRKVMDEVVYSDTGSTVILTKYFSKG